MVATISVRTSRCLSTLASFRISYIHRPHQQRAIGFPLRLACCTTTIMASSRRKRARTQADEEEPSGSTPVAAPATRRSQRTKLSNTTAIINIKAEPEEDTNEDTKPAKPAKKPTSRAKPKPVKSEDELDEDFKDDKASAKVSKAGAKNSKPPKKEEDPYLERDTSGFWLMKSEPDVFSYEDLCKREGPEGWDGVRNHVAKNHLRSMKLGDKAFFYHSNCKEPGIVGVMEITRMASVDESQFDPKAKYYDPKSTKSNPRWYLVHCSPARKLGRLISLKELKEHSGSNGALKEMVLFRQSRLSVSPVSAAEFQFILDLENKPEDEVA